MRWSKQVNEIGIISYESEGGCWIIKKGNGCYYLFKCQGEEYMGKDRTLKQIKAWAEVINIRQKHYIGYGE